MKEASIIEHQGRCEDEQLGNVERERSNECIQEDGERGDEEDAILHRTKDPCVDGIENMENVIDVDEVYDMFYPPGIKGDSEAKSPEIRKEYFRLYMCLALLVVIVGTVGAVLGILLTNDEAPASNPSEPIPYRSTLGIRENVARIVGTEQLDDKKNAYRKALDWIMYEDPAAMTPDNPKFMQRYLLAYFYYATTAKKPWESDCAPSNNEKVACKNKAYKSLEALDYFEYSSLRWLSEVDECKWAGILCDRSGQINSIEFSDKGMTGTFPEGVLHLHFLQHIWLITGELEGPLPDSLGMHRYLHVVDLSFNNFTGTIPETWFGSRALHRIELPSNQLSGTMSEKLLNLKDITVLNLMDNLFEGSIPNEIGDLENLSVFYVGTNDLNGTIPTSIGKIHHLESFDFSNNKLTGTIPTEMGMCDLYDIFLHENLLTGKIPDELWKAKNLWFIYLSNNRLNGTISNQITTLPNLLELKIQNNQFTGNLPKKLLRTQVALIHASGNNFNGTVPSELCDLRASGQLEELELDCAAPSIAGVPEIICPCCTLCCDPSGKECEPM